MVTSGTNAPAGPSSPSGSVSKESAYNAADTGLIPGSGRSPGEGNGCSQSNILAWRITMDRRAWGATVHGVAKSQTRLKQLSRRAHTGLSERFLRRLLDGEGNTGAGPKGVTL